MQQVNEPHRDHRVWRRLDDLGRDLGYATRGLRRAPGFTSVAVLTLALGIGAMTAIFSVVNSVLLQPLPFANADRLVRIIENIPPAESARGIGGSRAAMNQDEFLLWREQTTTLSHLVPFELSR